MIAFDIKFNIILSDELNIPYENKKVLREIRSESMWIKILFFFCCSHINLPMQDFKSFRRRYPWLQEHLNPPKVFLQF